MNSYYCLLVILIMQSFHAVGQLDSVSYETNDLTRRYGTQSIHNSYGFQRVDRILIDSTTLLVEIYSNGEIEKRILCKIQSDGSFIQDGFSEHFLNNRLKSRCLVRKGLLEGLSFTFDSNGNIIKKENYYRSNLTGPYEEYYSSGKIKIQGQYQYNIKVGPWSYYRETGKLIMTGYYYLPQDSNLFSKIDTIVTSESTIIIGTVLFEGKDKQWIYYDEKGLVEFCEFYDRGKLIYKGKKCKKDK
jgi:antitoxin component YwqK of YwqJK toxin-antitoxin module